MTHRPVTSLVCQVRIHNAAYHCFIYKFFFKWRECQKKLKIMYSSYHLILIKFCQLVVNIVFKELYMVFLTSTVINSNRNMKELERKINCEKLMFR